MDQNLIPNVSVDCVVFGFDFVDLKVLLIERNIVHDNQTYHDWKLPGDLVRWDEDISEAASRILKELTGLDNIYLKQLTAFGAINRINQRPRDMTWLIEIDHPEERVITIAYYSLINIALDRSAELSLQASARWVPIEQVSELAFDHKLILDFALSQLRNELKFHPIGFELLPEKFTLSQLQKLYELIFQTRYDKRNFRKKLSAVNYILPLKEKQSGVAHKPAQLFVFNKKMYEKSRKDNFDFSL